MKHQEAPLRQIKCHFLKAGPAAVSAGLAPNLRSVQQGQFIWWMKHRSGYCLISPEGASHKKPEIQVDLDGPGRKARLDSTVSYIWQDHDYDSSTLGHSRLIILCALRVGRDDWLTPTDGLFLFFDITVQAFDLLL